MHRVALGVAVALVTILAAMSGVAAAQDAGTNFFHGEEVENVFECNVYLQDDVVEEDEPMEVFYTIEYTGSDGWYLDYLIDDSKNDFERSGVYQFEEGDAFNGHIEEFSHHHTPGTTGKIRLWLNREEAPTESEDYWECDSASFEIIENQDQQDDGGGDNETDDGTGDDGSDDGDGTDDGGDGDDGDNGDDGEEIPDDVFDVTTVDEPPAEVEAGQDYSFSVEVQNNDENNAHDFEYTAEVRGPETDTIDSDTKPLSPGESETLKIEASAEQETGQYDVYLEWSGVESGEQLVGDVEIVLPEPELNAFSHSPDVSALKTPSGREKVTVEAEIENADVVELRWRHRNLDGQAFKSGNRDMEEQGEVWVQDTDSAGKFPALTNYYFHAVNEHPTREEEVEVTFDRKGEYRTFKHVDDIAVVYAKFSDSEPGHYWPEETGSQLAETQEFMQDRINREMASWRGSYGGVGFDFTFYDNNRDWFTLNNPSDYYDQGENSGRDDFRDDAIRKGNEKTDVNLYGEFNGTAVISPGDAYKLGNLQTASASGGNDIYLNEVDDNFATWIHELGHAPLSRLDLYEFDGDLTSGQVGYTGIMGIGNVFDEPAAPFSLVSKSQYHDIYLRDQDIRGKKWPWINISTPDSEFDSDFSLDPLESLEYGDTLDQAFEPPMEDDEAVEYLLSSRGTDLDMEGPLEAPDTLEQGVYIYRVETVDGSTKVTLMGQPPVLKTPSLKDESVLFRGPSLENEGGTTYIPTSDTFAGFELTSASGYGESYSASVDVKEAIISYNSVTSYWDDVEYPSILNTSGEAPAGLVPPDLRLVAEDMDGNRVSLDEEDGVFRTEIDGVSVDDVSGNRQTFEWIHAPSNQSILFEMNAEGVEDHIEYLEAEHSLNRTAVNDTSTDFTLTFDWFEEGAAFNESSGEIDGHVKLVQRRSLEPGESEAVAATAYKTEFNPETFNKHKKGRWVNVTLEVPHKEINVSDVDLGSVLLNGEVEAETNEKYGFVRNPVQDDVLKVKFPRDEVSDVLETGEAVTVVVSAETTEGELIYGDDDVRVIDRPPGEVPDLDCAPGKAVGPHDDAQGVAQGPIECPPGLGGDHPGQGVNGHGVGPDGTPPGHGGDNPGGVSGNGGDNSGHGGDNPGGKSGGG